VVKLQLRVRSGQAISIWVYTETGNATPVALVSFSAVLPSVLAAGLAGVGGWAAGGYLNRRRLGVRE
jgi:hypothetical protein